MPVFDMLRFEDEKSETERERSGTVSALVKRTTIGVQIGFIALACLLLAGCGSIDIPGVPGSSSGVDEMILDDATEVLRIDYQEFFLADDLPYSIVGFYDDSDDLLDSLEEDWSDSRFSFGTDINDVEEMVVVGVGNSGYVIVKGDFNFVDIEYELEDLGFEQSEYRDLPFWEDSYGESVAMSESDQWFVFGEDADVKEVLKAIDKGSGFKESTDGLVRALRESGDGLVTAAIDGCSQYANLSDGLIDNPLGLTSRLNLRGCESIGITVVSGDDFEMSSVMSIAFSDERRAENALEDLEDWIADSPQDVDLDSSKVSGDVVILDLTYFE